MFFKKRRDFFYAFTPNLFKPYATNHKKDTLMFLLIKNLLYFCTKKKIQQ